MEGILLLLLSGAAGTLLLLAIWELGPERRVLRSGGADGIPEAATNFAVVGHLPRLQVVHAAADGTLYGIDDHHLFVSEDGGLTFQRRGALPPATPGPIGYLKDWLLRAKLTRRLRGNRGPTSIEVLSSGTILVFWGRIFRSDDGGRSFEPVFDPAAAGLKAGPFDYGVGTAVGPDDTVYLGEYTTAARPHPVHILRGSDDGRRWEIAHRFEPGEIFHVHSITYDPYRRGYWVCTGDYDRETALRFTGDDFKTLTVAGGGSQDWRIVSLIVTPDYLYWGSDNDREDGAAIFRWDLRTRQPQKLQHIGKVSYYATRLSDGTMAIGTTYEPQSPYTKANSPKASSEVWVSRDGEHWQVLIDLPYEPVQLPWGPARAQIAFPSGKPLDRLFLIPRFTKGDPFRTVVLELGRPRPAVATRPRVAASG